MQLTNKNRINFWKKVVKTNNCWEWSGTLIKSGYGRVTLRYKQFLAHRVSWLMNFGKIPTGLFVLHKCDNRKCVNPNHLFLGDQSDNMRDAMKKGRRDYSKFNGTKLNWNTVENIRRLRKLKNTVELANIFKINPSHVSNICNWKVWRTN